MWYWCSAWALWRRAGNFYIEAWCYKHSLKITIFYHYHFSESFLWKYNQEYFSYTLLLLWLFSILHLKWQAIWVCADPITKNISVILFFSFGYFLFCIWNDKLSEYVQIFDVTELVCVKCWWQICFQILATDTDPYPLAFTCGMILLHLWCLTINLQHGGTETMWPQFCRKLFKCIFMKDIFSNLTQFSLKFVHNGFIYSNLSLIQTELGTKQARRHHLNQRWVTKFTDACQRHQSSIT